MAVNNVTTNAQMAYASIASTVKKTAQDPAKKKDEALADKVEKSMGEAYSVNLSAAGQQAAQKAARKNAKTQFGKNKELMRQRQK